MVIRPSVIYASAIPAAHTINTCHYRLYRLGWLILFIYYFIFHPSELSLHIDLLLLLYYVLLLSIALLTNLDPAVYRLHCIFFPFFTASFSPSLGWPAITNNQSYRAISDQRPFSSIEQPRTLIVPHLFDSVLGLFSRLAGTSKRHLFAQAS